MLGTYILNFLILFSYPQRDTLKDFRHQLSGDIQRNLGLPPETNSAGKCYHYTELLKVTINKKSQIVNIEFSDSAPQWLTDDFQKQKDRKKIDYVKLDSIAKKVGFKNHILIFPFTIESDDFPCGSENKIRRYPQNYFKFKGQYLKGEIIFGEHINVVIPTRYLKKTEEKFTQ